MATNVTLFSPYEKQRQFIDAFAETDDLFGIVVAPRGSGKTLLGINMLLYWALSSKNQKCAWVAPTFSQAKSVLDQIVTAANDLIETSNRMEATISFINGSTIKFLSADSADNIRGFRFHYLIMDEAAYMKETTINTVILPTLNPNGKKCLMISTPKGRNHLYTWYNKPEVVSMKFPLTECPYVSDTLIEEAKKSLPPDIFRQEYLADFVDSSNDVFTNIDNVSIVSSYRTGGDAFIGIDTGITDDMSVLCIMSPIGRVLNIVSINNQPINIIADTFINTMSHYNIVGGFIEVNGVGRGMYDLVSPRFRKVKPFNTNQDNKTEMVRKLINDIETTTIEIPTDELCPQLHTEFSQYTYKLSNNGKLSFSHVPGGHDDYIDSLLLANYSRVKFVERKPMTVGGIRNNSLKPSWGSPK